MFARLFLLFVLVPLAEWALLLKLAELTNWRVAMLLIVVTGLVGSLLARSQGLRTYRRIHAELSAGRMPAEALLDAVMILVAGGLLVTPGILTDLFGMSLLIPFCRRFYRARLARWIRARFTVHSFPGNATPPAQSQVVDSYVVGSSAADKPESQPHQDRDPPPKSGAG